MYEDEFNQLWDAQQRLNPEWCSERERLATHEVIFFQRPLKLKKNRRGRCSLEPSRFRAAMATLEAQEWRMHQDINLLNYVDTSTGELLHLDESQRSLLTEKLSRQRSMTWGAARKLLGLTKKGKSKVEFNLERSKPALIGNRTAASVRNIDSEWWDELGAVQRTSLIEDLLTIKDRYALYKRLVEVWDKPPKVALKYASLEFEPSHASLSLKSIRALLPHLRAGMIYSKARVAAGYGYESEESTLLDRLGEPPETNNPVVQKALYEVRKIVNAIIRVHGKPDAIRVEMARDLKLTKKMKASAHKQARLNEKANRDAAAEHEKVRTANPHLALAEYPSRDDLLRYRLWKEADSLCIYSGKTISLTQLWTADIEVDHILPYSRTLDDSYMNKIVCVAQENRDKSNSTPFEMWGGNAATYDAIKQRSRKCPPPKQARMLRKDLDKIDDFISRQLNDTRYISRLALGYMSTAFPDVSVTTGSVTAFLRHQWGLNSILAESGKKNRNDHRHHFVDATVVALVNRRTHQIMAREASRADFDTGNARLSRLDVEAPIDDLRRVVEKMADDIVISHAVNRKISGAFHEATFRGLSADGGVTLRVSVDSTLREADIGKVVDPVLRKKLQDHIVKNSGTAKQAFSEPVDLGKGRFLRHVKIRTGNAPKEGAYMELKDRLGNVQRRAAYGNTHHVKLYRTIDGKVKADFVTAFEAASRAVDPDELVIDRSVDADEELISVFHKNDAALLNIDGGQRLYRIVKLDKTSKRMTLITNRAATDEYEKPMLKAVSTLVNNYGLAGVTIDLLGNVTPN
jgi:CRISPR-associated endonuclease Csn1